MTAKKRWLRFPHSIANRWGGSLMAWAIRGWMRTLRYEGVIDDPTLDPAVDEFPGPAIFLTWHEYIPYLLYLRGHCDIAALVSQHRDAEWLSTAALKLGYETIRGSSTRGGVTAIRELVRRGRSLSLAITPDGPRGPRRELAPGCVYLASRLQMPLLPVGLAYDRPWRVQRAWDKFAVPRPFSKARLMMGRPVWIAEDADRDALEATRLAVQQQLIDLSHQVESWAEGGPPPGTPMTLHRKGRSRRGTGFQPASGAGSLPFGQ
jgi:lysophospholipid acyltransferase (LPLAT)-like uncharacterized protein